jgi:predicted dehydrogenase
MKQPTNRRGISLRFGLIGAGRIAQTYVQALAQTTNARLAAIADVDAGPAHRLAAQGNCRAYASHMALADECAIDAAIVATPPSTHRAICVDLLERGIAVLCEKPVSLDLESTLLMRNTAREHKALFTMASKFRYVEDVVRAREIIASGELGKILLFENTFMSFVDMSNRWNSDPRVSGGGVLIDNGTHSVDIMRYFIGPLAMIQAVKGPGMQGLAVEETVHVTVKAEQGAVGRMNLSWSAGQRRDDYITVCGTKGVLQVGWKESLLCRTGSSVWQPFGRGYDKVLAFRNQIENFSAAIQNLEALVIDAEDAISSVLAIQAGYQSLATDSWTPVGGGQAPTLEAA